MRDEDDVAQDQPFEGLETDLDDESFRSDLERDSAHSSLVNQVAKMYIRMNILEIKDLRKYPFQTLTFFASICLRCTAIEAPVAVQDVLRQYHIIPFLVIYKTTLSH